VFWDLNLRLILIGLGFLFIFKDLELLLIRLELILVIEVISELPEVGVIHASSLFLLRSAERKARDLVHDEKNEIGDEERPSHSRAGVSQLITDLDPVTVQPAAREGDGVVEASDVGFGEDSRHNAADKPSDAMDSKDIKGIVVVEGMLELAGQVTASSTDESNSDRTARPDEARGRSDSDEARDSARAESHGRELAFIAVVHQHPSESSDRRSEVGNDAGHGSAKRRRRIGATIETEPAKPEKDCAEDDVGDIVGLEFFDAVAATLAEDDSVSEGGSAR